MGNSCHGMVRLREIRSVFKLFEFSYACVHGQSEHFQHRSHALMCTDAQSNNMWAISEARKMDLTRSLSALAKPAGETYLGSTTYAEVYHTDTLLQVTFDLGQESF